MVAQPVDFTYRLTGTGWSEASLRVGEQVVHLTASYLGDALGDFLTAIVLLTEGAGDVRASWQEEPGECRFVLTREGDVVRRVARLTKSRFAHEPSPEQCTTHSR